MTSPDNMLRARTPFFALGCALADYVNHPDYDKGQWWVLVEAVGQPCRRRLCANKVTAEAWVKYLRRRYGSPLLSGVALSVSRADPLPGFPKKLEAYMPEHITTIAALKRALTPGRKLRFVRHVFPAIVGENGAVSRATSIRDIEPTKQARTVKVVRSKDVIFLNHVGEDTYLTFSTGDRVAPLEGGFKMISTAGIELVYVFEKNEGFEK